MTAWTFLYYGHPDTRYLDGGLGKWTAERLPLSSDAPATSRGRSRLAQPRASTAASTSEGRRR